MYMRAYAHKCSCVNVFPFYMSVCIDKVGYLFIRTKNVCVSFFRMRVIGLCVHTYINRMVMLELKYVYVCLCVRARVLSVILM